MHNKKTDYFDLLKQKIVATMQQSYPGINPLISEWKGQEITDFQEDLIARVNAHISEKWFYNHIKSKNKSLPRIDVLNLLSKYVGYANWDDFVYKNSGIVIQAKTTIRANRYFIVVPVMVLIVLGILFIIFKLFTTREYHFSFYDAHTKEDITGSQIEIKILSETESPKNYLSDTSGNFKLKTDKAMIKMVIDAPYYHPDTITRVLRRFEKEQKISLTPNDYALVIHYLSEMNVDSWLKRREYLGRVIDDGAMIYQVFDTRNGKGMEIFNKEEFIDKLTMPAGTLKNIEILDTKLKEDRIIILRFRINR